MKRFVITLFVIALAGGLAPHGADAQDVRGGACPGRYLVPIPSLRSDLLRNYSLQAVTRPPNRILNPGETYQIRYNVITRCINNCAFLKDVYLQIRAEPGADRSRLDRSRRTLITVRVKGHRCGDARVIFVRFTAPVPRRIGGGQQNVETISMGLCPPYPGFNCAGHTIRVRNQSAGGWRISGLTTGHRSIGGRYNQVPSGRRITLRTTIRNMTGREVPFAGVGETYLNRIVGPGMGPATRIASKSMPGFSIGQSRPVSYSVGPLTPGVYAFKACIAGVSDGRGFPLPEFCGPGTSITVGNPAGASWRVSAVQTPRGSNSAPPGARIDLHAYLTNLTAANTPAGARFVTLWRRKLGDNSVGVQVSHRESGFVRRRHTKAIRFVSLSLTEGEYQFRACATDDIHEPVIRTLCGPWSTISVSGRRVENSPIPPTANPNRRRAGCTGGRVRNAARRCVCPSGSRWNWNTRRCYPLSPSGRYIPPDTRRPVAIRCTGGWVRQGRCYCPRSRYRVRTGRYSYSCRLSARQTQPRDTYRAPPPPARLRCLGGQVRGTLCWCGFGRFPQRIGNNVYRCR